MFKTIVILCKFVHAMVEGKTGCVLYKPVIQVQNKIVFDGIKCNDLFDSFYLKLVQFLLMVESIGRTQQSVKKARVR